MEKLIKTSVWIKYGESNGDWSFLISSNTSEPDNNIIKFLQESQKESSLFSQEFEKWLGNQEPHSLEHFYTYILIIIITLSPKNADLSQIQLIKHEKHTAPKLYYLPQTIY